MCRDWSSARVINVVWLALFLLHMRAVGSQVSVTFTSYPDPPTIDEGDTAVFNCSSNHSAVLINWLLNKTFTSHGVVVYNILGTLVSSLTISGLVDPFNNTEVQCAAVLYDTNDLDDFSPSPVILRVQGIPSEVNNLTLEQTKDNCIKCNWEAPFTLTGINGYDINITNVTNSEKTVLLNTSDTTLKYCPGKYGHYKVSVAANNDVGLGVVASAIVELRPKTTLNNVQILSNNSTKEGHWNFTFTASITSFLAGDYNIIAHFNGTTNATGINDTTTATGNAVVDSEGHVKGTIRTGRLDERKWNMFISLKYGTSNILISKSIEINTFGLRKPNVTVHGSRICIETIFIDGSYTEECLVEYKCSDDHSRGSINITRQNPHDCTKDVDANNYTVTLYAGRFNDSNKIFAVLDARVMINTKNTALITETSSVILLSSSSVFPSSTISVNANETSFPTGLVVILVVVTLVLTIVIAFTIVIIALLFSKKKNRVERANKGKHEHADNEIAVTAKSIHSVVYMDTEVPSDRPRAPPTMVQEQVQYTKIKNQRFESQGDALYSSAIPITEDCSVVAQNISENPNNSEYSHLNSRGYKSPCQPELACNDKEMYSTIPLAHGNMNKEFSYAVLAKYVAPHISHKWEKLGLALALTPDDIEQLKENHQGINDVFLFWEQHQTRPFTWETLIMALKSINEHELADRL